MIYAIYTSTAFVNTTGLAVAAGATVEVRLESTGALATIYSARTGTGKANPFTADSSGRFEFYAAGGAYKVTITSGANTHIARYQAIGTAAEYDVAFAPAENITALKAIAPISGSRYHVNYHTTDGDNGGGVFRGVTGAAPGSYVDNNGTIIVPTGGDGSAAFLREYTVVTPQMFGADNSETLLSAQTAAGVKPLLKSSTGTEWKFGITAPTFDEASSALGRNIAFDTLGATISITAGKQYNLIGMRNGGGDLNFTLGASSAMVTGLSFYMSSQSGSHSSSNLYGVIGNLNNYGPGTTKALYGRVTAKSGMTGNLIAGVLRTQLDTGSSHGSAYCLQIGHAGDTSKVLSGVIKIDTEAASGTAAYGILSDIAMGYTTAFIRGVAGGGGKAFQWQAAGGGADLMNVLESGQITLAPGSANTKMLDLQSGARINFTATSPSATTGGAGAPPAQVAQYILVQINGTDYKIPVYNV